MCKEGKLFFHMAVMFYNSTTENVKRDNVIKKIIENTMYINNNKNFTCTQLSAEIYNRGGMTVTEEEIANIVTNPNNGYFEVDYSSSELIIRLSNKRYNYLSELNEKNMDYYIEEFVELNGYGQEAKETINKFIYDFYCRNVNDLNNILDGNISLETSMSEMSPDENSIVQEFVEWENEEKNKMFHALANSALEYLLVSGDIGLLKRQDIRSAFVGKKLYIDTNILFYCMGINGKEFETANRAFLKKCRECKEEIIVSYYTDCELKTTISHFVKEIQRLKSPLMHRQNIYSWITNKDVYSYYLIWSRGQKALTDAKFFEKFLIKKYEDLIKEYNITVERTSPLSEEVLEESDVFKEYETQIISTTEINYDARNIFLIETKRGSIETSLQNTNTIFITADKSLQRWDAARKKEVPVVVAPNLWLLLLSRLVSRSVDDFKCFISYINMLNTEQVISNKEFFEVVKVISDIVEDVRQQENVLEVMIEEEFAFLENSGEKRTSEFIVDRTEAETNRILSEKVSVLEKNLNDTNERLEKSESTLREVLSGQEQMDASVRREAYEEAIKLENEKKVLEEENIDLKKENEILTKKIQCRNLCVKRILCVFLILLITLPLIFELINVFLLKDPNPISWRLVNELLNKSVCEPENIEEIYLTLIYGVFIFIVGTLDWFFIKALWIKNK